MIEKITADRPRGEKRVVAGMVLIIEAAVLAYAVPMAFLLTALFETDTFAFQATEFDWWIAGGKKLAVVGIAAAILATSIHLTNSWLFRWIGLRNPRLALYTSAAAGIAVLGAGLFGTAEFILTKPFM